MGNASWMIPRYLTFSFGVYFVILLTVRFEPFVVGADPRKANIVCDIMLLTVVDLSFMSIMQDSCCSLD